MFAPDIAQMLVNFRDTIPSLMALVTSVAYVSGIFMIVSSVSSFRNAAFISSPGQGQTTMWDLLRRMFVGALLIYLPSTVNTGALTFWSNTSPLAYMTGDSANPGFQEVVDTAFEVIYLVGTIAVIKGLHQLSHLHGEKKDDGGSQSGFSKGITHFIGGILCINLHVTLAAVFATLGITGLIN